MTENEQGPMQAAQRAMRPRLPKRFYKNVSVSLRAGQYAIDLDRKPARTPGKRLLAFPSRVLAEAVAREWEAVAETIDPANMPLTRLANAAIDRVADHPQEVIDEMVKYARSDLICYRAKEPEGLVSMQNEAWTMVLDWLRKDLGASFKTSEGVQFVEQDRDAIAIVRAEIENIERPFELAALASATNLTGSALISLMLAKNRVSAKHAWFMALVDELWNVDQWGEDEEAKQGRESRKRDFDAAATVLGLAR